MMMPSAVPDIVVSQDVLSPDGPLRLHLHVDAEALGGLREFLRRHVRVGDAGRARGHREQPQPLRLAVAAARGGIRPDWSRRSPTRLRRAERRPGRSRDRSDVPDLRASCNIRRPAQRRGSPWSPSSAPSPCSRAHCGSPGRPHRPPVVRPDVRRRAGARWAHRCSLVTEPDVAADGGRAVPHADRPRERGPPTDCAARAGAFLCPRRRSAMSAAAQTSRSTSPPEEQLTNDDCRQRPGLQGRRSLPGRVRPQGDHPRRARDARPDVDPQGVRRHPAAGRRPHHGLAAHDRADRRPHRDPGRPGRRGPLGLLQHLLHPGPRGRRHRRRPERHARRTPRASRSSPGRARPWRSTGGARSRR